MGCLPNSRMRVAIIAAMALAAFLPSCEAECNNKGPWDELDNWARNIATGRDKIGEDDSIITNLPYGTPCEVIQAVETTLGDCSSQLGQELPWPRGLHISQMHGRYVGHKAKSIRIPHEARAQQLQAHQPTDRHHLLQQSLDLPGAMP